MQQRFLLYEAAVAMKSERSSRFKRISRRLGQRYFTLTPSKIHNHFNFFFNTSITVSFPHNRRTNDSLRQTIANTELTLTLTLKRRKQQQRLCVESVVPIAKCCLRAKEGIDAQAQRRIEKVEITIAAENVARRHANEERLETRQIV